MRLRFSCACENHRLTEMHLCLFEDKDVRHLYPLTLMRPAYDLRVGRRTLAERLIEAFDAPTVLHCRHVVAQITGQTYDRVVNHLPGEVDVLFVNGRWYVEEGDVLDAVRRAARPGQEARLFAQGDAVVAAWVPGAASSLVKNDFLEPSTLEPCPIEQVEDVRLISRLWHPFDVLDGALRSDFRAATQGYQIYERPGADVSGRAILESAEAIFVGPHAQIRPGAILNAEEGPIYIEHHAVVSEGAVVRGPCFVGEHALVSVGANLRSASIGPWCKVGGEVHDTIMHSYSNKAHSGFLGHAYLGSWCNLGADTNNSNLKNDYGDVTLHNSVLMDFEPTDRQFLGMVMADHSKCGINSMFNTGTVIGVFCNIFGTGYVPRVVPSFSWGTPERFEDYQLEKALHVAKAVMARRSVSFTDADRDLLEEVFRSTAADRKALHHST